LRTHSTYDDPKFIGQRFGRLTVEEVVRRPGKKKCHHHRLGWRENETF